MATLALKLALDQGLRIFPVSRRSRPRSSSPGLSAPRATSLSSSTGSKSFPGATGPPSRENTRVISALTSTALPVAHRCSSYRRFLRRSPFALAVRTSAINCIIATHAAATFTTARTRSPPESTSAAKTASPGPGAAEPHGPRGVSMEALRRRSARVHQSV
jgi:hypothetical protein